MQVYEHEKHKREKERVRELEEQRALYGQDRYDDRRGGFEGLGRKRSALAWALEPPASGCAHPLLTRPAGFESFVFKLPTSFLGFQGSATGQISTSPE